MTNKRLIYKLMTIIIMKHLHLSTKLCRCHGIELRNNIYNIYNIIRRFNQIKPSNSGTIIDIRDKVFLQEVVRVER